jgi:hypothetical protein
MDTLQELTNYSGPAGIPTNFWSVDVQKAIDTGADPYLLAAIAQHETAFGTLGAGREGYTLGYGYPAPGQGDPFYQGVDNQLFYAGQQINSYFNGDPITYEGLLSFAQNSWKPGDPKAWADSVWNIYQGYQGKDPKLTGTQGKSIAEKVKDVANIPSKIASSAAYFLALVLIIFVGLYSVQKIFS